MNKYIRKRISKTETRDMHRIIMEKFLGRRLKRNEVVHHKDENKSNNAIDNLQLKSAKEHARLHYKPFFRKTTIQYGNCGKLGSENVVSKLNEAQVIKIREDFPNRTVTIRKFASQYNISHATLIDIIARRTWKHL